MAGSSAPSMENLGTQGMERHQIVMNNEFMKHFGIMNRNSVREIMLQHERTFKEQVHDLHKLYEVQRLLMEKAKGSGHPWSTQTGTFPEAPSQSERARNFWELLPSGNERVVSGGQSASTGQDKSKSSNSTVRKRKIDLEQLPTDDSDDDDEMGSTIDTFNPITSKEVTQGHQRMTHMMSTSNQGSMGNSSGLHPFQLSKGTQINAMPIQNSSYVGTPNLLTTNSDQSPKQVDAKSPPFHIGNVLNGTGFDTGKSNGSMPFLHPDRTNQPSKGVGRDAAWFPQSCNGQVPHMGLHPFTISSKPPQQHPHLPSQQLPCDKSYEQNGIFKGSPSSEPQHDNKKCVPMESLLGMKAPAVDSKPSYANEAFPKGTQLGSIAQLGMAETRPAEGGCAVTSLLTPALVSANIKGPRQKHDTTMWSPQKYAQFQQSTSLSPQVLNQAIWLPSSQNSQSSLYSQQIVYGGHPSDASQFGHLSEALPKNPSDAPGPWTMSAGFGHYYSSAGPVPQEKPPFKKPPRLVLANDGAGMELRLASPAGEEKASQRKPMTSGDEHSEKRKPLSSAKDSPPSSSESQGGITDVQREAGKEQKLVDAVKSSSIQGSTSDVEPSMIFGGMYVPMPAASLGEENVLPQTSTTAINHVPQVLVNSSALIASSAPSENGCGSKDTASPGTNVHDTLMEQLEAINTDAPLSTGHHGLTEGGLLGCSLPAMENNLSVMKGDADDERDNAPSSTGRDAPIKGGLLDHFLLSMENNSSFMKGDTVGCLNCHGVDHVLVPCGSRDLLLAAASSMTPKDAKAALSQVCAPQKSPFDADAAGRSESSSMEPSEKRAEGSDANICQEEKRQNGSHASQLAALEKDAQLIKNVPQGTWLGHGFEISPSRQPTMPAVSTQSTSSGTPGCLKQEKCSIVGLENSASHKASGKSSSAHQSRTATPTYDRECPSFMSESKPDWTVGGNVSSSSEEFQEDSDSDNLAATILLSFAPKAKVVEKPPKDNVGSSSGGSRKRMLVDRPASSRRRSLGDSPMVGVQSGPTKKSKDGQRPQILVPYSPKKVRHAEPIVKPKMNDRRREEVHTAEPRTEKKVDETQRSGALKLPRVVAMGSLTDEAVRTWKSKHLNKIDGAMLGSKSANSPDHTKSKSDVFHAPTGRRSSRGPPPSVRMHHHESKGRTQQQHLDGGHNQALTDGHSRSRGEGADSKKKAPEVNMKGKAWGDLNKARGHLRKVSDQVSHRKTQRWLSREGMP